MSLFGLVSFVSCIYIYIYIVMRGTLCRELPKCMEPRTCLFDDTMHNKFSSPGEVPRLPWPVGIQLSQVHLLTAGGTGVLFANHCPASYAQIMEAVVALQLHHTLPYLL